MPARSYWLSLCTGPSIVDALVVWVSCASPSVSQDNKPAHPPAQGLHPKLRYLFPAWGTHLYPRLGLVPQPRNLDFGDHKFHISTVASFQIRFSKAQFHKYTFWEGDRVYRLSDSIMIRKVIRKVIRKPSRCEHFPALWHLFVQKYALAVLPFSSLQLCHTWQAITHSLQLSL